MITRKIDCILNKVDFTESHLNVTSTEWDRRVATPPDSKKVIFHLSTFCGNFE